MRTYHKVLTPQKQASIYATGLLTILTLGTLATILLCIAALWLVAQVVTLLLASAIECLSTVAQLYTASDPRIKFVLLVAIGYAVYRVARRAWRF